MSNRIAIYTCILPRLEVFFLDEWIQHHLNLGIEHIYIYNNGYISKDNFNEHRRKYLVGNTINTDDRIWSKKPDNDYNLQYTDEEIQDIITTCIGKYHQKVTLIPWYYGDHHTLTHPDQQLRGYVECVEKNQHINWWLHIDPDEYVMLYKYTNIVDLIQPGVNCYKISQRVFDIRARGNIIRKIYNYGYDHCVPKALISKNIHEYHIHHPVPTSGDTVNISKKHARIYHYRGHPSNRGNDHNMQTLKKIRNRGKEIIFNKIDKSMSKYL